MESLRPILTVGSAAPYEEKTMQFFEIENEAGNKFILNKDYIVKLEPNENDFKKGAVIHLAKESVECSGIHVNAKESVKIRSWLLS